MLEIIESHNLKIVLTLTIGFSLAAVLGYLTQRLNLSPILGYLFAGYVIGPYSPGFVADSELAEQLAEIGVILMMFGVGLHFKVEDLFNVKNIAIPGAIGQTLIATLLGMGLVHALGGPIEMGLMLGLAVGVASTVVLVRVLTDNNLIDTPEGHVAVGWSIVEDILTVAVLILVPTIALWFSGTEVTIPSLALSIGWVILRFLLIAGLMFTVGSRLVTFALFKVARTRSHELFTLAILALTFAIATGSALLFGTSIALGAFIAGMVIGRTEVRYQALVNSQPMKDAFVVIFFLSVGMIFNPQAIIDHFTLFIGVLGIVLIGKPLAAFLIVLGLKHPMKTALTVAIAIAQIAEFSFVLAEEALKYKLMPDEGYDIIVACALISISLNPTFFKAVDVLKGRFQSTHATTGHELRGNTLPIAIVVGYGPIGQQVVETVTNWNMKPIVIDRNVDTIVKLRNSHRAAVFGDASQPGILDLAHIEKASLLIITNPELSVTKGIVGIARHVHPGLPIIARVRYTHDIEQFQGTDIEIICCESESIKAFEKALVVYAERCLV